MAAELRRAPWFALSIALHALLGLILWLCLAANPSAAGRHVEIGLAPEPEDTAIVEEREPEAPDTADFDDPLDRPLPVPEPSESEPDLAAEELEPIPEPAPAPPAFETPLGALTSDGTLGASRLSGIGMADLDGLAGHRAGGRAALRQRGDGRTADAIERGLEWLTRHQNDDGRWDGDGFYRHDPDGTPKDGTGAATHDVGLTGLALLALLGDGNTLRAGPYREHVRKGVRWLVHQQSPNGRIGPEGDRHYIYDHAIATFALCEAYGLSQARILRDEAQAAVRYVELHRHPYGVWRYEKRSKQGDLSVVGWCLLALKSARDFELEVNQTALDNAAVFLDSVTDDDSGRHGYTQPRNGHGEAMTAVGIWSRLILGQQQSHRHLLALAARRLTKALPNWNAGSNRDFYAWYYGSYALYQLGGSAWSRWSRALEEAVVLTQRGDGRFRGSWDPESRWGDYGGRVYSTAMLTMTLEAHYRYTRLVR